MSVLFRGRPACECQAKWIPVYERELQRRGIITGQIPIAQLIGGAPQSGGTHVGGGASDFWLLGDVAERAVWVARQMGADATWHRLPGWDPGDPSGGSEHIHSVLRGCPHLAASAKAQVTAVDSGGDGLVGSIPDPGPRPLSGRTWQQGIEWQNDEEDHMTPEEKATLVNEIAKAVWDHVVREADKSEGITEQTAKAALKKAANR